MTTRIAVTTIVRGADLQVPASRLRVLDLDARREIADAPLPDALLRARDPNPRGGVRGGRGLAALPDRLAVALNDRVLVLDSDWRLTSVLSDRLMGGIHDIAADGSGLWITCADIDVLLRVAWDGTVLDVWHWRTDRRLRRALGFGWLPHFDRHVDHRDPRGGGLRVDLGHVNAVSVEGGPLLVGLGLVRPPVPLRWMVLREHLLRLAGRVRLDAPLRWLLARGRDSRLARVLRIPTAEELAPVTPGRGVNADVTGLRPGWTWAVVEVASQTRVVARHPAGWAPAHNCVPSGREVFLTDSPARRVLAVDRHTGEITRSVELPGQMPFPRGLARLPDGRFAVGRQMPAGVAIVDLEAERVDEEIPFPDDRGESAYAISLVPDGFASPEALPTTRAGWCIPGADASAASR